MSWGPLALVALFCGVVTAIQLLWSLLAWSRSARRPHRPLVPNWSGTPRPIATASPAACSPRTSPKACPMRTLDRFATVHRDRLGTVTDSAGFSLILDARRVFSEAGPMEGYQPDAENLPRPIYLHFGDRRVLTYVFTDQRALQDKKIRIRDMLLIATAAR